MKTLILIRHAKSSWDVPVSDKDRELIHSGIESIKKVSNMVKPILPEIFTIWCSTAKRAMQTASLFCQTISIAKENIIFNEDLYTFNANDLLETIKKCSDNIDNLIVFGHNSAITDFANYFGNTFIQDVPTSGLVYIKFEIENWENIIKGKTIRIIFPKEI